MGQAAEGNFDLAMSVSILRPAEVGLIHITGQCVQVRFDQMVCRDRVPFHAFLVEADPDLRQDRTKVGRLTLPVKIRSGTPAFKYR
jgi:hypothetical protein